MPAWNDCWKNPETQLGDTHSPGDKGGRKRASGAADRRSPANVKATVQLLRRDRPDLLTPQARALIQPPRVQAAATNATQGPAVVAGQTPSTSACGLPHARRCSSGRRDCSRARARRPCSTAQKNPRPQATRSPTFEGRGDHGQKGTEHSPRGSSDKKTRMARGKGRATSSWMVSDGTAEDMALPPDRPTLCYAPRDVYSSSEKQLDVAFQNNFPAGDCIGGHGHKNTRPRRQVHVVRNDSNGCWRRFGSLR
ncbi:hypothetical protein HPB47_008203, partial [Ixodes persulcatus]